MSTSFLDCPWESLLEGPHSSFSRRRLRPPVGHQLVTVPYGQPCGLQGAYFCPTLSLKLTRVIELCGKLLHFLNSLHSKPFVLSYSSLIAKTKYSTPKAKGKSLFGSPFVEVSIHNWSTLRQEKPFMVVEDNKSNKRTDSKSLPFHYIVCRLLP